MNWPDGSVGDRRLILDSTGGAIDVQDGEATNGLNMQHISSSGYLNAGDSVTLSAFQSSGLIQPLSVGSSTPLMTLTWIGP